MSVEPTFELICPHCEGVFLISQQEINCGIVRHGGNPVTNQQVPPHASEEECKRYSKMPGFHGCFKPVRIIRTKDEIYTEKCDYI